MSEQRGLQILLVAGGPEFAALLAPTLDGVRHAARTAGDGAAALEAARVELPEVVFLDVTTPGLEVAAVARSILALSAWRRPFVVAVSDCGRPDCPGLSHRDGIDLHLPRPLDHDRLRG